MFLYLFRENWYKRIFTKKYLRDTFWDFLSGSGLGMGWSQLSSAFLGTFPELSSIFIMKFENFRKRRCSHIPGLFHNSKYQESCGDLKIDPRNWHFLIVSSTTNGVTNCSFLCDCRGVRTIWCPWGWCKLNLCRYDNLNRSLCTTHITKENDG